MKQWKVILSVAAAFGLSQQLAWAVYNPAQSARKSAKASLPEAVPGEFVIQLEGGATPLSVQVELTELGVSLVETINSSENLHLAKVLNPIALADKLSVKVGTLSEAKLRAQTLARLSAVAGTRFAEPNFIYHILGSSDSKDQPNDPKLTELWAMKNFGQKDSGGRVGKVDADISAAKAWALEKGTKQTVVAIIDTGVDFNHPDLKANIWDMPGNPLVHGYNAITNTNNSMDDNNHGSHCAGTIGGVGDNGVGVVGVNWNVSIMGVKFLTNGGSGTLADAVKAIDWAAANGAQIMSNSWGGGGFSQAMYDSIERASDKGILFIAAAGNESSDNDKNPAYPASYVLDNVIAVAASNNVDEMATFSNWGRGNVHLLAPGENIVSTVIGNKYASYSGTSMATPHVSGAAALLLSHEPSLNPSQVRERLMRTSDKLKPYRSKIASSGRLNIYNLIANITPPGSLPIPDSSWREPIVNVLETAHPYVPKTSIKWKITQPGAKFIRVHFEKFETELKYDFLTLRDGSGQIVDTLSGNLGANFWSLESEGDTLNLEFSSDDSINGYGIEIDSYSWTDFSGKE